MAANNNKSEGEQVVTFFIPIRSWLRSTLHAGGNETGKRVSVKHVWNKAHHECFKR